MARLGFPPRQARNRPRNQEGCLPRYESICTWYLTLLVLQSDFFQGGEESTPTYLRQKYPNGGVIFKNAAVGEIGSTCKSLWLSTRLPCTCVLIRFGSPPYAKMLLLLQLLRPTRRRPRLRLSRPIAIGRDATASSRVGTGAMRALPNAGTAVAAPGALTGRLPPLPPKSLRCRLLQSPSHSQLLCRQRSPSDPTTLSPTRLTSPTPTVKTGCYSNNFKDCLPESYLPFQYCNTVWLPDGAQQDCTALVSSE